MSLMDLF